MEIKYEAVFGPQELFDGFMDDCEFTDGTYGFKAGNSCVAYCERHNQKFGWSAIHNTEQINVIAMRRIIRTPTWTVEDQKAGRLPEVGCRIYVPMMHEEQNVIYSSEKVIVSISDNEGAVTRTEVGSIDRIKPIETSEERAKRLREEWCIKALSYCPITSEMQRYELKRLGGYIEDIYDALLSGELKMPEVHK